MLLSDKIDPNLQKIVFSYCYHSVYVISLSLSQSDHIKQLPLYIVKEQQINFSCKTKSVKKFKIRFEIGDLRLLNPGNSRVNHSPCQAS
jgi:hypothetical protein